MPLLSPRFCQAAYSELRKPRVGCLDAAMLRCRSLLTSQRVTAAASSLKFLNTFRHSAIAFVPKSEAEERPRLLKLFNWL